MKYKIDENNANDIVRFFSITEGFLRSGTEDINRFLEELENNQIQYSVEIDSTSKTAMVIAYNYNKK